MNSASKFIEDNVHCPVCLEVFSRPQALLPCLHTICESCVRSLTINDRLTCPACRTVTRSSYVVPDFKATEQVEIYDKLKNEDKSGKRKVGIEESYSRKCDLCEEHVATCYCDGCKRCICNSCRKTHVKLSGCTLDESEPIEDKVPKLKESLTKTAQELEVASQQLLEAKNEYINSVKDKAKQCLDDMKKWKAEVIKQATAAVNEMKDSVTKAEGEAIRVVSETCDSINEEIVKNLDDVRQVSPHKLVSIYDLLQEKLQQSINHVKDRSFVPYTLQIKRENSNTSVIVPKLQQEEGGKYVDLPFKGGMRHTFQNVSKFIPNRAVGGPNCKIGGTYWQIVLFLRITPNLPKSLSAYACCGGDEDNPHWRVATSRIAITLISQIPGQNFSRSWQQEDCFNQDIFSLGKGEFITWEELSDPNRGLLVDDSVVVEAFIETFLPSGVFMENKEKS